MTTESTPAKVRLSDQLGPVPRWWDCDTHGPGNHTSWGCPECVRALRTLAREQAVEIQTLRDALNTAGGALFRLAPACIEDDDERARAEHARAVGLAAVEHVLKRKPYVEKAIFGAQRLS